MPLWYSQNNFGESSSVENYGIDVAMGGVSTPTSKQWTPQEDTSDEQAFSGDLYTPSHSIEDGFSESYPMTDFQLSNLGSPELASHPTALSPTLFDGEEPNDLYSTSDILRINEMSAGTYERDLIPRSARPSVQGIMSSTTCSILLLTLSGIPQAGTYSQTAWLTGKITYPDDRTSQSCLLDYCISGATPSALVWEERLYTGKPDEASTPVIPRYIPGSRPHPWSPYAMDDSQVDKQPSPEQLLFALGSDAAPGSSASPCRPNIGNQPTHPMSPGNVHQPASYIESDDSDDTIDRPPPDNPVGPPPQFVARRPGHRYLNPDQKANAALMRKIRSCWNCALSKYPVGRAPARGLGEQPLTNFLV